MNKRSEKYIIDLISEGEHLKQDFKFEINDARKIARTLVAFSNSEGGRLLIGVKDNGIIKGVHSEEEYYMIEAAASMYCKPDITYSIKRWTVNGKAVLEVIISPGKDKPYYASTSNGKWMAYIRNKDEDRLAHFIHLKVWKRQKSSKGVYLKYTSTEKQLLELLENEKSISLNKYCKLTGISRRNASEIISKMISLGLVKINYDEKQVSFEIDNSTQKNT